FFHCARRRATSGRSCSAACRLFFERHILGTEEVPDRFATHLDVAPRQFGAHPSQGQVRCGRDPRQKPIALWQKDQLPVAPPHRPGRRPPGCPGTLTPAYHARLANPQQTGHFPTAPSPCHQRYGTLTKIQRVRTRHSCWPPHPSQHLESQTHPQGNPSRFTSGETGSRIASSGRERGTATTKPYCRFSPPTGHVVDVARSTWLTQSCHRQGSVLGAAGPRLLDGRTGNRSVRAEHAAVALFRLQ